MQRKLGKPSYCKFYMTASDAQYYISQLRNYCEDTKKLKRTPVRAASIIRGSSRNLDVLT